MITKDGVILVTKIDILTMHIVFCCHGKMLIDELPHLLSNAYLRDLNYKINIARVVQVITVI